jgi:hypothetical protein
LIVNFSGALIWGLQALLVACATGVVMQKWRPMPAPSAASFLFGVSVFPFVLAGWMFLLAWLVPGALRLLFAYGLALVALCFLMISYRKIFVGSGILFSRAKRKPRSMRLSLLTVVACAALTVVFVAIGYALVMQMSHPTMGGDASQYLLEALHFAKTRTLEDIIWFQGTPDGRVRGDIHSPVWSLYLANALMADFKGLGFPHDCATRLAFILTNITLIAALIAAILSLRSRRSLLITAIALCLFFLIPEYGYLVTYRSRDALRLTALLLLVASFASLIRPVIERAPVYLKTLIWVALAGTVTSASHALGTIIGSIVICAWFSTVALSGGDLKKSAFVALVGGIGIIVGSHTAIAALIVTGSVVGDNVIVSSVLKGTPYFDIMELYHQRRIVESVNPIISWFLSMSWPAFVLSIAGLIAAIGISVLAICGKLRKKKTYSREPERTPEALFLALTLIGLTLIVTGMFDIGGFRLSTWFAMNLRYGMQNYLISALLLSMMVSAFVYRRPIFMLAAQTRFAVGRLGIKNKRNFLAICSQLLNREAWNSRALLTMSVTVLGIMSSAVIAYRTIDTTWHSDFSSYIAMYDTINAYLDDKSCKQLTEVDQSPYYIPNPPIQLFSKTNRAIFDASTPAEVLDYFDAANICIVVQYENFYLAHFPDDTLLKIVINDPLLFETISFGNGIIIRKRRMDEKTGPRAKAKSMAKPSAIE